MVKGWQSYMAHSTGPTEKVAPRARGLLPHAGVEVKRDRSAQANLLEISVRWIEKIILLLGNDGRGHS